MKPTMYIYTRQPKYKNKKLLKECTITLTYSKMFYLNLAVKRFNNHIDDKSRKQKKEKAEK